jgi:hypothetical protein
VLLEVWVSGSKRAEITFPPVKGWATHDVDTAWAAGHRADVEFRIRAARIDWRFFGFRARAER